MELQLIRNATMRLGYNGRLLLLDPFLSPKHAIRSFAGISPNPTVDLPMLPGAVVADVAAVVVSHLHPDHFDEVAQAMLAKELPLFCQPGDEGKIGAAGFTAVTPINDTLTWQGISITRTPAQHGTGQWAERMGNVSGFIFRADGEPTIYWAGDTIWYEPVAHVIRREQPDIIITHSGGAHFGDNSVIVMDIEQTLAVCQFAPQATVVAVHLEALDHCPTTRADLRAQATASGIAASQLRIPADGETVLFGD
ncbi:MAG: MBL fold metallo-hydrolase [Ardenticatenaceae bacterium]|nr:MBL fold metallo-hydrolase [Ardenticatenaceae bacterium]